MILNGIGNIYRQLFPFLYISDLYTEIVKRALKAYDNKSTMLAHLVIKLFLLRMHFSVISGYELYLLFRCLNEPNS